MALVSLSPGNLIACPFFKPVKIRTVSSLNFFNPTTLIPPKIYSFPFSKEIFFVVVVSISTTSKLSFCVCAFALKVKNNANSVNAAENNFIKNLFCNLFACLSKSSFSILVIYDCIIKMFFSKIWPKYICKI